jgi:Family of unknown function (DUF6290)
MTISVRFDDKTKQALKARAKKAGVSVSALVRMAVIEKLESDPLKEQRKTPYELWQEIFSGHRSGESDRSERAKELVGKAIDTKHRRRIR